MASDLNDLIINQRNLKKLTDITYNIDSYSVSKEIIRPSLVRGAKARENLYQAKCKEIQYSCGLKFMFFVGMLIVSLLSLEAETDLSWEEKTLQFTIFFIIFFIIFFLLREKPIVTHDNYIISPNNDGFLYYIGSFFISGSAKKKLKQWVNSLQPTPLGTLIDEVYNYNKVVERFIKNVKVIDQLKAVGNPVEVKDRDKVIKAFRNIKSDLERAIKTEKILRENPDFKPEEFSIDLTFLRAVRFEEKAQTYAEFVNDAIDIGLRVQEEMKNLHNWS